MVKRSKTSPFHGGNPGSSPGGVTTQNAQSIQLCAFCVAASTKRRTRRVRARRALRRSRKPPVGSPTFNFIRPHGQAAEGSPFYEWQPAVRARRALRRSRKPPVGSPTFNFIRPHGQAAEGSPFHARCAGASAQRLQHGGHVLIERDRLAGVFFDRFGVFRVAADEADALAPICHTFKGKANDGRCVKTDAKL